MSLKKSFPALMLIAVFTVFSFSACRTTVAVNENLSVAECKNIIYLIGDGMGFNSIEKTKHDRNITLDGFEAFTLRGESRTRSASSKVTDSAAGGTALATGVKTINGYIGVYASDGFNLFSHPLNLAELAISKGKLAGIVTTDKTSGATPSAFSAHTLSRKDEKKITAQQLESELTLCWGMASESFTEEEASQNGFTTITDKTSMDSLAEGSRSFGQFGEDLWHIEETNGAPTLTQMTEKAIDLLDDDPDGFFLMVEAAHIDKNNHSNNGEGMTDALTSFDETLSYVIEYAEKTGDTLVVVTADHETGGITLQDGEYIYTVGSHTGANVPVFVYGSDSFMENGEEMENIEIARRIALAMGENDFPQKAK